ncbi:MAG: hypothetical protein C0476_01080 [Sphingomonas sp.]|nr:hypothetical protein [Sphingomonas sp.]
MIENKLNKSKYLPNARRNRWHRFWSSKDITFQVSLTTETGRFKEVTPLLLRRYESARKKGENFVREVTFSDRQFPLFLATGDPASQIAKFTLDVSFNNKPATDAGALSLDFLSNALKAISPTSAVVTSLTSESAGKVASKIDEGIGQFFSVSSTEKSRFDIDLYNGHAVILTVFGGRTEDTTLNPSYIVGQWQISFAPGRPSIFSSELCHDTYSSTPCPPGKKRAAYAEAVQRPNAVLSFALIDKVGKSGTVLSYLKQQDWWASDLGALNQDADYDLFCRKIRGAMGEIGLSDTDGRIIAYAVSQSQNLTKEKGDKMKDSTECEMPPV